MPYINSLAPKTVKGKTVLITGGASGLGKAPATRSLAAGANVIICDINQSRIDETLVALSSKGTLRGEFRTLDILINNAGIMDRFDPVGDLEQGLWDRVITVNLTGPFLLSKAAVKVFLDKEEGEGEGYILNVASLAGRVWLAAGAAYTARKHGLVGLTKNTSSFYAVDAFQAGVNTEGQQRILEIFQALKVQLCDLDDVADLSMSLSEGGKADLLNGTLIHVDNGWGSIMG
ncbi:putative short chain dehydrogenase/ reductase [Aspergillus crustosus]